MVEQPISLTIKNSEESLMNNFGFDNKFSRKSLR